MGSTQNRTGGPLAMLSGRYPLILGCVWHPGVVFATGMPTSVSGFGYINNRFQQSLGAPHCFLNVARQLNIDLLRFKSNS